MAKHRKAEQLPVRRWLTLSAASAGMGAALWGLSLAGPQVGVASADTESSVSVSAGDSGTAQTGPKRAERRAERAEKRAEKRAGAAREIEALSGRHRAVTADRSPRSDTAGADTAEPTTPRRTPQERAAAVIDDMTASALTWIDSRPVSDARKERLEQAWSTTRRTLLNQAPTVNPVQVTGVMEGPISGTVGAEDPDGDRLVYRVVKKPTTGTVAVNRDGSYTYTPGDGFNGVDTFVVAARDLGLHVNVLNWFRPALTRTESVINHRAITYDFTWVGDEWTPDRKAAFQRAADYIAGYFVVRKPVALSYELAAINDPAYLVNASTQAAFTDPPGLMQPVIQKEVITGFDDGDGDVQAFMEWNFAWKWATGDVIADDEMDFQNTARHELLHSFGIYSLNGSPDDNPNSWASIYDSFLTFVDGTPLLAPDGSLRPGAADAIKGLNGGVYFSGPHAVAAYGKPIPVSADEGSRLSHLPRSVFSGDDFKLMNDKSPGPGWHNVRDISPIEYGMLQDIGYTMRPKPIS